MAACLSDGQSAACKTALANIKNPFFLEDEAGATQTNGWVDAWEVKVSPYAVAAESAADVSAAVQFAVKHNLRLVVKGTGHDYFGRSNAADSLLVWTHHMRDVRADDSFIPAGATKGTRAVPVVHAAAGARWLEGYTEVTTRNGRYVQGGGCTSVGMAGGFIQGGGYGSFSRRYGNGAAGIVEAEIVLADGQIVVCNAFQHADLWWAIKGGGAGTFGVVTRITLATHEAPTQVGILEGTFKAKSESAWNELVQLVVKFWGDTLMTEHWGEKITFKTSREIDILLLFSGFDGAEATRMWAPLLEAIQGRPSEFEVSFRVRDLPFRKAWNLEYFEKFDASMVSTDDRGGDSTGQFWWAGDSGQVSQYIAGYFARYMPASLLADTDRCVDVLVEATTHATVEVHVGKGLAGANAEAVARSRETSVNPTALDAAGLFIIAGAVRAFPGLPGHEPDVTALLADRKRMKAAFDIVFAATPGAGSYVNESDFHDQDWAHEYWGAHYPRLLDIKNKYDPDCLFWGHHLVGSEQWVNGGMQPA